VDEEEVVRRGAGRAYPAVNANSKLLCDDRDAEQTFSRCKERERGRHFLYMAGREGLGRVLGHQPHRSRKVLTRRIQKGRGFLLKTKGLGKGTSLIWNGPTLTWVSNRGKRGGEEQLRSVGLKGKEGKEA